MNDALIPTLITASGCVILLLISAVAFFVIMFIKDVKQHSIDIADLRGKGTTHVQKVDGDIKLLTERTELQIQQVNKNVGELANLVKTVFEHYVNKDNSV